MQCTMYNVYFVENYVDFLDAADDDVGDGVDDDDYFLVAASGVEKNMTALLGVDFSSLQIMPRWIFAHSAVIKMTDPLPRKA